MFNALLKYTDKVAFYKKHEIELVRYACLINMKIEWFRGFYGIFQAILTWMRLRAN